MPIFIAPLPVASQLNRRTFLRFSGTAALGAVTAPALIGCATTSGPSSWRSDPFTLGVAAGDPAPDGFVLWTRLAPEPLSADTVMPGGIASGDIAVSYEIATDPAMRTIVRRGTAIAESAFAHSVHLEVHGLEPGRPYWYRFRSANAQSRIGKAMTLPARNARIDRLRYAFVSCANYEIGYFSAYRHLTDEAPDLIVFLGDYIYEYMEQRRPTVRKHIGGEAMSLPVYRNRYAQYRMDADLQRLHAEIPMIATWDDHEVDNDYSGDWSMRFIEMETFLRRRAAAYQAFYEHMPLRPSRYGRGPNGPAIQLYDRFAFGDLMEIALLDPRQYRSRLACPRPPNRGGGHLETLASCTELSEPARSFLGAQQEGWLFDGLTRSRARWNVIAQSTLMAQWRQRMDNNEIGFWTEDWNGYPWSRTRLLQHLLDARITNPVVIGGDIHSFWANDLKLDFDDPKSPTVATEFVGSSITSFGPPHDQFRTYLPDNPHVRYFEARRRGYVSVELTPARMTTHFRAVSDVRDPKANVKTLQSFVVENGRAGAVAS